MEPIEVLFLSMEEVIGAGLSFADAVASVETSFREHGAKRCENPPKPGIHPLPDAFIHAMPAYLPDRDAAGMKWVGGFSGNPAKGFPSITGVIVLNDTGTGRPLAIMDCAYITALRTAAASGVAARHLANPDAAVIGVVGAGVQGRYNALALKEVLPAITEVRAYDTDAAALDGFVAAVGEGAAFAVRAARSAEDAIAGADVIVTATGKLDGPIFRESWVKAGALVLPIHHEGWEEAMIEKADRLIVDDWAQLKPFLEGLYPALRAPDAELGEIVAGVKPGRENPEHRIVDFNLGIAVHDIVMATEVLARARAKGLGTPLTLMAGDMPYA